MSLEPQRSLSPARLKPGQLRDQLKTAAARATFRARLTASTLLLLVTIVFLIVASRFLPTPWLVGIGLFQLSAVLAAFALNLLRVLCQPNTQTLVKTYFPLANIVALFIAAANGLSAVVVFEYAPQEYRILYLVSLAGISGLQAIVSAAVRGLPTWILALTLVPQGVWFASQDAPGAYVMASVTAIWLIVMMSIAYETRTLLIAAEVASFRSRRAAARLTANLADLRHAKRQIENSYSARSKFFAAISHDMRQPLHALSILTSLLKEENSSDKKQDLIKQLDTNLRASIGVLNQALDLSRLEADLVEPSFRATAVQSLLDDLVGGWMSTNPSKRIITHALECNIFVLTDPDILSRILRNYLGNALRHGGATIDVSACIKDQGNSVRISVSDDGPGIPLEEQQWIFDEYRQGARASRDSKGGLGLGLSIAKTAAALLDHDIGFSSIPCEGATFWVDVPVTLDLPPIQAAPPEDLPESVLLIEDDQAISMVLAELLRTWTVETRAAGSLSDALGLVSDGWMPKLIIADLRLPGDYSGPDVVRELREKLGHRTPVVYVTGNAPSDAAALIGDTDPHILFKPVEPSKLRSLMAFIHLNSAVTE